MLLPVPLVNMHDTHEGSGIFLNGLRSQFNDQLPADMAR